MLHDLPLLGAKPRPLLLPKSPISRKLDTHITLSPQDKAALDSLEIHKRFFMKGCDIIHEGQQLQTAYVLCAGWACSYKLMRNGTRQVISFYVPGDLIGIRRLLLPHSDDNLYAITRVEVGEINVEDLLEAFHGNGCLAMSILWSTLRDEAILVQHLVDVGRRRPIDRVAHFFLELSSRLSVVGLGTKTAYQCPLTQSLIADALGLTAVHFNRVLRQLRELNAMTFHEGWVRLLDSKRLERLADFDSSYLQ
ncbi:MAG TPA: Crp/Fnr family transcriptional regulator [Rhizobium sp.]